MALFQKPRLVRLVEVASRAELLRRKRQVRGVAIRGALGAAAAVFGLLMLSWLHLTAWRALAGPLGPVWAALVVAAVDLALLVGLGAYAARGRTDGVADGAVAVRDVALDGAMAEVRTLGGLLRPAPDGPRPDSGRRVRTYPPL